MRKSIKKILSLIVASSTIFGLTSICANAEWRQDNTGWWYTENDAWATGWRIVDNKWYYFDNNGYMKTGWIQDNSGNWYYLYSDGSMASNTSINGYIVNENGIWYKTEQTTNNPTTNSNNTTTVKSDSSSSESSSDNSSSSSSHHSSRSDSSSSSKNTKYNPETDQNYVTVFYDDTNSYDITRISFGKYEKPIVSEYGYKTQYGVIADASQFEGTGANKLSGINKNYKLVNDNGTLKLVKKATDDTTSKSGSSNNTTQTPVTPVITPTQPTQTTGSAVIVN